MKLSCFSVWDEKAKAFLPPFFLPVTGVAVRSFADCCNDRMHAFGRNPHDYTLFIVGEFDDHSGTLEGRLAEIVVTGPAVVKREGDDRPDVVKRHS